MAFVPRRSPRLAEKAAKAAVAVAAPNPVVIDIKKESRATYLRVQANPIVADDERTKFVAAVKQYLDDLDRASVRESKVTIVVLLFEYIIRNPSVVAAYPQLRNVIVRKMEELSKETIDNPYINRLFRESLADLMYVIS